MAVNAERMTTGIAGFGIPADSAAGARTAPAHDHLAMILASLTRLRAFGTHFPRDVFEDGGVLVKCPGAGCVTFDWCSQRLEAKIC